MKKDYDLIQGFWVYLCPGCVYYLNAFILQISAGSKQNKWIETKKKTEEKEKELRIYFML